MNYQTQDTIVCCLLLNSLLSLANEDEPLRQPLDYYLLCYTCIYTHRHTNTHSVNSHPSGTFLGSGRKL